jgi:hypothetical protein
MKKMLPISGKEKSERGFKMFMVSNFFLWTYVRNSNLLASRFGICERSARGEYIWKWIMRIAALKAKMIYFPDSVDNPDMELFAISTDRVDFEMNKIKHHVYNIDKAVCSVKKKHAAAKYELAISVHHARCCHISGPYKGLQE